MKAGKTDPDAATTVFRFALDQRPTDNRERPFSMTTAHLSAEKL
jgi:hypothetical protein